MVETRLIIFSMNGSTFLEKTSLTFNSKFAIDNLEFRIVDVDYNF